MITLLAAVFYVILLELIRYYLKRLYGRPIIHEEAGWPEVSVVVPYRNEIAGIGGLLKDLRNQNYPGPDPELIFVDDHSSDGSEKAENFPGDVIQIHLAEGVSGKKAALTSGIMAAKGEWIVTTDADAEVPPGWLRSIIRAGINHDAVMVCGQVETATDGSFLQDFQRMETIILQGTGLSLLNTGIPFLNTGASLAFRKDVWLETGGYESFARIPSGDDVFLLFQFAGKYPGRIVPSPESRVSTRAVKGFLNIVFQRVRWVSKIPHYKSPLVFIIAMVVLGSAFSWLYSLVRGEWTVVILAIVLRAFAELRLLEAASAGRQSGSMFHRILMVLFYPFFLMILMITSLLHRPAWKGRRL